jgi:hypothetical protein
LRKIEGMKQFILKELMPEGLLLRFLHRAQIVKRETHGELRRNDLHISTVDSGDGCAQNFVTSHDFVDAALQDRRVARRSYSKRVENIETGYVRQRVL